MFSFTEIKRDLHAVGAEAADECGLGREAQSHYDLISIFEDQLAQLDEVLLSDTGGGGTTTTTSQFMVHRRHAGKGAGLQNAITARRPQVNVHGGATFCHSDFFLVSPTGFTHGTHAAALLATC